MDYRKVWEKENGPVPVDENGRKYEIHHIDGNRKNNSIDNLTCLSIKEHYDLHLKQMDYQAAGVIASRMKLSKEELNFIYKGVSDSQKGKPKPWLKKPRKKVKCPWCETMTGGGGHQKSCKKNPSRKPTLKPKLSERQKGVPKKKVHCEFCNKAISLGNQQRHTKSCRANPNRKDFEFEIVQCPHCKVEGGLNVMNRWHFKNCKNIK